MQREDIEVTPGQYWTETLPLTLPPGIEDLSDYEFRVQVIDMITAAQIGQIEAVVVSGTDLLLEISPTTIAAMSTGAKQRWGVLARRISTGKWAVIKQGAVKKIGVGFSWQ